MLYRHHQGHSCDEAYTVISLVHWDGLSDARAREYYQILTDMLPKYGLPTNRKCDKNDRSVSWLIGCFYFRTILSTARLVRARLTQEILRLQGRPSRLDAHGACTTMAASLQGARYQGSLG